MKEKDKRTDAARRILLVSAVLLCAAILAGLLLSGCAGSQAENEGAGTQTEGGAGAGQEERTPVAYLGGNPLYLDEAVFYTRMLQEQWEYAYYESFGEEMWQQEATEDGQTFADALKSDVLELLTEIELLCSHAEEYGAELTEGEKAEIAGRAGNFMASNTPEVLEAAGATAESVKLYLTRNELAARTAQQIKDTYEPVIDEEAAKVGKLTYCLFSSMGTYDEEGNHTPFTEEELSRIRQDAEDFAVRAQELGDISAAGEEISHTLIDVYFNDSTNGGAHEKVAEAARALPVGQVSEVIETEDGWYVVQHISDYDESATQENLEAMEEQAREEYLLELEAQWEQEGPLEVDTEVWDTVVVDKMLTAP